MNPTDYINNTKVSFNSCCSGPIAVRIWKKALVSREQYHSQLQKTFCILPYMCDQDSKILAEKKAFGYGVSHCPILEVPMWLTVWNEPSNAGKSTDLNLAWSGISLKQIIKIFFHVLCASVYIHILSMNSVSAFFIENPLVPIFLNSSFILLACSKSSGIWTKFLLTVGTAGWNNEVRILDRFFFFFLK